MKKSVVMTIWDVALLKIAVLFASLWLVGLVASFRPFEVLLWLIRWKWALFSIAIILGIIPARKFLFPEKKSKGKNKK